jgi:hypothetical protein
MATIPTLHGSPVHMTAVALYGKHYGDVVGLCVRCGERSPCSTRAHAASVITAAGDDPRRYDQQTPPEPGPTGPPDPNTPASGSGQTPPDYSGYQFGGRGARDNPAGFLYSREP